MTMLVPTSIYIIDQKFPSACGVAVVIACNLCISVVVKRRVSAVLNKGRTPVTQTSTKATAAANDKR